MIHRLILSVVTMVPWLFFASSANAVPINAATTGLSGSPSTITFSEIVLPNLTAVGANYGGLGVTFNGDVLYAGAIPPPLGPVHMDAGPNFSPPDLVNFSGDRHWLMTFNNPLKEVAFAYASGPGTTTFTALR